MGAGRGLVMVKIRRSLNKSQEVLVLSVSFFYLSRILSKSEQSKDKNYFYLQKIFPLKILSSMRA